MYWREAFNRMLWIIFLVIKLILVIYIMGIRKLNAQRGIRHHKKSSGSGSGIGHPSSLCKIIRTRARKIARGGGLRLVLSFERTAGNVVELGTYTITSNRVDISYDGEQPDEAAPVGNVVSTNNTVAFQANGLTIVYTFNADKCITGATIDEGDGAGAVSDGWTYSC